MDTYDGIKPPIPSSPYEDLLRHVLTHGVEQKDRTGTGTIGVFGTQSRYDLREGFPLITTKKVFHKGIFVELCWMMKGYSNIEYLREHGVKIWDAWADAEGNLGPVYGQQWRGWPGARLLDGSRAKIDQLGQVIEDLKADPFSRRHLVTAWNPEFIDDMALPPCHTLFQFNSDGTHLDLQLFQRSADLFLGVPFNIASYAALTHVVGKLTGLKPREFIHTIGSAHVYLNHLDQVHEQIERDARPFPHLQITSRGQTDPRDFEPSDFVIHNYKPHPAIKGEVSV